jgi:hypothetical protein
MAKKKTDWISDATSKNKGAFKKAAERAGKSTAEFAADVLKPGSKASTTTKKRAQLAQVLSKLHKPKKGGK